MEQDFDGAVVLGPHEAEAGVVDPVVGEDNGYLTADREGGATAHDGQRYGHVLGRAVQGEGSVHVDGTGDGCGPTDGGVALAVEELLDAVTGLRAPAHLPVAGHGARCRLHRRARARCERCGRFAFDEMDVDVGAAKDEDGHEGDRAQGPAGEMAGTFSHNSSQRWVVLVPSLLELWLGVACE